MQFKLAAKERRARQAEERRAAAEEEKRKKKETQPRKSVMLRLGKRKRDIGEPLIQPFDGVAVKKAAVKKAAVKNALDLALNVDDDDEEAWQKACCMMLFAGTPSFCLYAGAGTAQGQQTGSH